MLHCAPFTQTGRLNACLSLSKKYVMPAKRALKSVFCHGSAGAKNTSIRTSVQATPRCARLTQRDAALTQRDGLRLTQRDGLRLTQRDAALTRPCAQCGCSCRKSRKTFSTDLGRLSACLCKMNQSTSTGLKSSSHGSPHLLSASIKGSGSNSSTLCTPAAFHLPVSTIAAPIIAGTPVV